MGNKANRCSKYIYVLKDYIKKIADELYREAIVKDNV